MKRLPKCAAASRKAASSSTASLRRCSHSPRVCDSRNIQPLPDPSGTGPATGPRTGPALGREIVAEGSKRVMIAAFVMNGGDRIRMLDLSHPLILTTEDRVGEAGETLVKRKLVWVGAPGGTAWRQRPLRLAYERDCFFRQGVQRRLDDAGIPWEMAVDTTSPRTVEATVSADLAVHTMIEGNEWRDFEKVVHGGLLPDLTMVNINPYRTRVNEGPVVADLVTLIRRAYHSGPDVVAAMDTGNFAKPKVAVRA